jgi:hypothetical protein
MFCCEAREGNDGSHMVRLSAKLADRAIMVCLRIRVRCEDPAWLLPVDTLPSEPVVVGESDLGSEQPGGGLRWSAR